jgi:hypothetical protein
VHPLPICTSPDAFFEWLIISIFCDKILQLEPGKEGRRKDLRDIFELANTL